MAFYGPDNLRASKVAVGIVVNDSDEVVDLERWFSEADVRSDASIATAIEEFIRSHEARSVVVTDRIIGCPHEEVVDYPAGQPCPRCPYWANRDRFSGKRLR